MKTTEQWWDEVSNSPERMIEWLKDQYYGEVTAGVRIAKMQTDYPDISDTHKLLLGKIADDEFKHAEWVAELLITRGIIPRIYREKPDRYWRQTLAGDDQKTFTQLCAIGHHAEVMRLERIELLAKDRRFEDIADVFGRIRPDEIFHAKAFKAMSTPEDIEAARGNHEAGKAALGLVA